MMQDWVGQPLHQISAIAVVMRALQGLGLEGKKLIDGIMEIQFEVSVFFFFEKKVNLLTKS